MMATASANVRVQVGDRLASSNALASLQRPEGAGMGVLFQHFPDSEAERDFVRSERADRAPAIRALILIAIATLGSYIVMNPMHFPRAGVLSSETRRVGKECVSKVRSRGLPNN